MAEVLSEETLFKKSPQELTRLLYRAFIEKLDQAIKLIEQREFIDANRLLQRCNDILYRLGAGINYEAGIIADQLEAVYNYMADKLIEANIKKDIKLIEEVRSLMEMIADAWDVALTKGVDSQGQMVKKRVLAYDQDMFYNHVSVDRKE